MRGIALGVLSSCSILAVSDVVQTPWWIQGGAFTLLAGVLYWLLTKELPAQRKVMQDESAANREERKVYYKSVDKLSISLDNMNDVIDRCRHNQIK
jgi:membrane protein implicated in regulation of membrane protease activity